MKKNENQIHSLENISTLSFVIKKNESRATKLTYEILVMLPSQIGAAVLLARRRCPLAVDCSGHLPIFYKLAKPWHETKHCQIFSSMPNFGLANQSIETYLMETTAFVKTCANHNKNVTCEG